MVRVRPSPRTPPNLLRTIFIGLFVATAFVLLFVFANMKPNIPNGILLKQAPTNLATPNNTKVTTDVRGNLGPPITMIQDGTDWIKDRWQAASDMQGTAIKGEHQVLLSFHFPLELDSMVLDWEAAFSNNYVIEGALSNMVWFTLYDTQDDYQDSNLLEMGEVRKEGKSPGVKDNKMPLHVIHPFTRKNQTSVVDNTVEPAPRLQYLRLTIRSSAMGWGVSLWRVKVFGWRLQHVV